MKEGTKTCVSSFLSFSNKIRQKITKEQKHTSDLQRQCVAPLCWSKYATDVCDMSKFCRLLFWSVDNKTQFIVSLFQLLCRKISKYWPTLTLKQIKLRIFYYNLGSVGVFWGGSCFRYTFSLRAANYSFFILYPKNFRKVHKPRQLVRSFFLKIISST